MKSGYLEARKWLDELVPNAHGFRQKYPDYKALESKNYEDYES